MPAVIADAAAAFASDSPRHILALFSPLAYFSPLT
jgi:hypothetical protein